MDDAHAAVTQLRAYLAQADLPENARLPAERELSEALGVSRTALRKALAALEHAGEVWRHVGKGTFLGARPAPELDGVGAIAARTNPAEVMRARLMIEPALAAEAALNAGAEDIAEMRACLAGARCAESWRGYESWDNRLHRVVARSAGNLPMLALFDQLNAIRRAVVWGRLRPAAARPPADHHSFADHEAIVAAIAERDLAAAHAAMRRHLSGVLERLERRPAQVA
jgi:DNA-binding FadR family transcriptional regulator